MKARSVRVLGTVGLDRSGVGPAREAEHALAGAVDRAEVLALGAGDGGAAGERDQHQCQQNAIPFHAPSFTAWWRVAARARPPRRDRRSSPSTRRSRRAPTGDRKSVV